MTPPEYSVLLLAWDDADPQVAVLGGEALPPTLPLVYQLAAQHPVVALYPHLPADENPVPPDVLAALPAAPTPPADTTEETPFAAPDDALATPIAQPGVLLLPASDTAPATLAAAQRSRIVGLSDLAPAAAVATGAPPTIAAIAAAETSRNSKPGPAQSITTMPAAPGRSQWPIGRNAPVAAGHWQAPAAPYLGAGSGAFFPPPPPAPARPAGLRKGSPTPATAASAGPTQPAALDASDAVVTTAAAASSVNTLRPRQNLLAGDLNFDPDPELPAIAIRQPALFDEPTEEVGAAEANAISAPEDNIVPDAPAPPELLPLPDSTPEPAVPTPQMPQLDGLNFRMIQYARQAAQLVHHRQDFGVIYAPNWPAWLAALEIRNSSRLPLVLYVAALALDFTSPAERGWLLELERMTLRRTTLVLVPNDLVRQRVMAEYGDIINEVRVVAAADEATVQRVLREVAVG
jgi:hypothetical protein